MWRRRTCHRAAAAVLAATLGAAPGAQEQASGSGEFRGAAATEYPAWFKESFLEFGEDIAEAAAAGKRVVLFFHQDGCPYCNRMVERNLAQRDIERLMRERLDVVAINLWGDREVVTTDGEPMTEKAFAASLGVQFTPTLVFLDERGEVALRLNGYHPPQHFALALEYVTGRHERDTTWREYFAAHAPAPRGSGLEPESFFARPPHVLLRAPGSGAPPLAVFFEQSDCPDCDTLHANALADPATRALFERLEAVQLDMWAQTPVITPSGERTTARAWAEALGITYAPTVVYFDGDGREVIRAEAWLRTFHTQSAADYVLSGAYREQPSFQRYLSDRADALRGRGIDVDIWR